MIRLQEAINQHYDKLNESDQYILKYILKNKRECAELGINDLAKKCNVSRTTIFRLAKKLGFKGYSEFKFNLKLEEEREDLVERNYIQQFYQDINETVKLLQEKDFTGISKLIYDAERVFVYGTGTAQMAVARELKRTFLIAHKYFHVIEGYRELEVITPSIKAEDIVIFISLSGNTTSFQSCVNELAMKEIEFISITKLSNNKLSRMTPHNLYIPVSSWSYKNGKKDPFAGFFILTETLLREYVSYQEEVEAN